MIIKFRIISGENEDFVRDIELKSEQNFLDFHLAIESACNFDNNPLACFFMSNDNWDKGQEIVNEIMDAETQKDCLLTEEVKLSDMITKKGQKIIYIFDLFSVRAFFIEVVNIREVDNTDKDLEYPICTLAKDPAPKQFFIDENDMLADLDGLNDEFDDGYDDLEGFDNIDDYDF
jgi:hypothetical protein